MLDPNVILLAVINSPMISSRETCVLVIEY